MTEQPDEERSSLPVSGRVDDLLEVPESSGLQHRGPVTAMASIIVSGPDGQDWLDVLREAPERLDCLDHEGWALVPKAEIHVALAALNALDAATWGGGSSFDRLAARVGFVPAGEEER